MSGSLGEGARGLPPYRTRTVSTYPLRQDRRLYWSLPFTTQSCLPATNFNPAGIIQPAPTWFLVGPSAEVLPSLSTCRLCDLTDTPRIQNQYSVLTYGMPSSVGHCGTQVHDHPQMPVHWGPEQSYTFLPSQDVSQPLYL